MTTEPVLLDCTAIPPNRGGVGRYVESIVKALAERGDGLHVVCQSRDKEYFEQLGVHAISAPKAIARPWRRLVWEQVTLPRLANRLGIRVVHSPHYTFPLTGKLRRVVTIHDLTFFTMPTMHSRLKGLFFRWWITRIARREVHVVAVSQTTADEFIRITGAARERITVAPLGYDASLFHTPDERSRTALRDAVPSLPASWIAFLGTLEPRKNSVALIKGYCLAMERMGGGDRPALLLAGGQGWDRGVDPAIETSRREGFDVRKLGYLPLDALPSFLGDSVIFAYPSLGEGFGLPILEAMATGACVLTTDNLSLPEVGGPAVAYTGTSSEEIAAAISSLLGDARKRNALSSAALSRSRLFGWAEAAERHIIAYEAVSE